MSISGISGSSLFSELSSSSVSSSSNTTSQSSFQSALKDLMTAIQSGDTTDAKKYLAQVEQLTPSNASSNSPLGQFISSVSTALQNNDISSAQSARHCRVNGLKALYLLRPIPQAARRAKLQRTS